MAAFFGGLLMAVGILIATLSGLCSGYVMIAPLLSGRHSVGDAFDGLLLFGGLPFLVGLALFFAGRRLYRNRDLPLSRPRDDGSLPPL